jgi:hypothetical protein
MMIPMKQESKHMSAIKEQPGRKASGNAARLPNLVVMLFRGA